MIYTLPLPLLLVSFLSLGHAQQLVLNEILPLSLNQSTPSISLNVPSATGISLSVALCTSTQPLPNFTVKNAQSLNGTMGSFPILVDEGIGTWSGSLTSDSSLSIAVEGGAQGASWNVEVAISSGDPLHRTLSSFPLLGDTTSTQAILFSPPFSIPQHTSPSFPNYTLPGGNISLPSPPPSSPNFTAVFTPTISMQGALDTSISKSACAIIKAAQDLSGSFVGTKGSGTVNGSTSLMIRDYTEGWRTQVLLQGLTASTNYTAWLVQDGGAVSGPIFAFTKSSSFSCTLAHSLPFCPRVSYSIPLQPPSDGTNAYTAANLPSSISDPLMSTVSNFTSVLLTFPCGRDIYSFKQTCETCQDAYRNWACAVSLPRCGELPPTLTSTTASPSSTSKSPQNSLPALLPHPPFDTRVNLSDSFGSYTELLPCIESCYAVDRSCPPFLSWKCPLPTVNANYTYGLGYINGWDGSAGKGSPGVAQDRFGVAWCNG